MGIIIAILVIAIAAIVVTKVARRYFERAQLSSMTLMELGAKSSQLAKVGEYDNMYSRELIRRCASGVKE